MTSENPPTASERGTAAPDRPGTPGGPGGQGGPGAPGGSRAFRFAVSAALPGDHLAWAAVARSVADQGYDTLLIPDTAWTPAPFPVAAVAASAAPGLRVGSYVLAAPLYTAATVARESDALQELTGGRFELGIGAGRPDAADDAARFDLPFPSAADRIALVESMVATARRFCGERAPRVLVAGSGPRMLQAAGRVADTVALGLSPTVTATDVLGAVRHVRDGAGDRFDDVELSLTLLAVGDREIPQWIRHRMNLSVADLRAAGSVCALSGDPSRMAGSLQRLRDTCGISHLVIELDQADALAPVVALLAGH